MQKPLQITAEDFPLSAAMEAEIRERAAKLETFYEGIIGCRVAVAAPITHHRKGGPFKVRIDLTVPGAELVVNRQEEEELSVALREAFDTMRRRLEDYARRQRGAVKTHVGSMTARVSKLFPQEGYGFLETPDGREIYFHSHSVLLPGFAQLQVGMTVRFVEEQGYEGPQASTVTIVHHH
jgi:cold shock CspA family protein